MPDLDNVPKVQGSEKAKVKVVYTIWARFSDQVEIRLFSDLDHWDAEGYLLRIARGEMMQGLNARYVYCRGCVIDTSDRGVNATVPGDDPALNREVENMRRATQLPSVDEIMTDDGR